MLVVFTSIQNIVRLFQTQITAPTPAVPAPSVDYTPRECVRRARVLQLPHVGRQLGAVPVVLVAEISEVVRVSGSVAPRSADVQLLHVVALLVLRGDGALVHHVLLGARPRHRTRPRTARARRVRLRRRGRQQLAVVCFDHGLLIRHAAVGQLQVVAVELSVQRVCRRK